MSTSLATWGGATMTDRCPRADRPGCERRHCRTCGTWHLDTTELQTCIRCVGATARAIRATVTYAALLPDQAIHGRSSDPHGELIPGGDALVMLVGGSEHATGKRARYGADNGPAAYSYPSDPTPPLVTLATWEDDWRHVRRLEPAGPADMTSCARFLLDNLAWAAQHHPAFDQFANEMRGAAYTLEAVLHTGERDEVAPIARCIRCEHPPRLRATYADPHHQPTTLDINLQIGKPTLDQGGRRDYWTCPKCHEVYSPADYVLATEQAMMDAEVK